MSILLAELKVDRTGSAQIRLVGHPVLCSLHYLDKYPPMVSLICPRVGRANSQCFGCKENVMKEEITLSACYSLHDQKWRLLALSSSRFEVLRAEISKYASNDRIAEGKGPDLLIQTHNKFLCTALIETMSRPTPVPIPNIQEMIPNYASKSLWAKFNRQEIEDWYNRSWRKG